MLPAREGVGVGSGSAVTLLIPIILVTRIFVTTIAWANGGDGFGSEDTETLRDTSITSKQWPACLFVGLSVFTTTMRKSNLLFG